MESPLHRSNRSFSLPQILGSSNISLAYVRSYCPQSRILLGFDLDFKSLSFSQFTVSPSTVVLKVLNVSFAFFEDLETIEPAIAAMHGPHSVFICYCTVIHSDAGDVSLVDQ